MPISPPPLNALRAFEASARLLSFKKASEELFVTPSAVSQQIKSLEDYLGVTLFLRSAHGISITTEGKKLLPTLEKAFADISSAVSQLTNDKRIPIRISAPPAFTSSWLGPRLQQFEKLHPDYVVSLHSSLDPVNFVEDGFDCAVRVYFHDEPSPEIENTLLTKLQKQHLLDISLVCVCNPELLVNKHGTADSIKDLKDIERFNLLHYRDYTTWTMWSRYYETNEVDPSMGVVCHNMENFSRAIASGQGVALIDKLLLDDAHFGKYFNVLFADQESYELSLYFVAPQVAWHSEAIITFKNWLLENTAKINGYYAFDRQELTM